MKKSLLALAVLGAFAGAASAQTNVTLYGIADVGIQSYDADRPGVGSGRTTRMISGGQSASRIGFRGTEDLSSGLKANFVLEQGFGADDGSAAEASQFSRLAYVGLQGGFGAVALGKQVSSFKDAHDKIDPFGAAGSIGNIEQIFYNGSMANATGDSAGRPGNTIKYSTPNFGGFNASASYTFGETFGSTATGRDVAANIGYANGPLVVQFGAVESNGTTGTGAAVAPTDNQTWFLGAAYNFGVVKLHAAYADYDFESAGAGFAREGRNGLIGVTVPFGASALVASYARNDVRGAAAGTTFGDSDRIALMITHDLSKRTNVYAGATYTKNDAGALLTSGSAPSIPASTPAFAGENDPRAFTVGVRHRF